MSKYTIELRHICENYAGSAYTTPDDIINASLGMVFDFSFPMYREQHRCPLEKKIIKHFYMREIGLETVDLWKLFLNRKLNEIMPYYNELYRTAEMIIDPLDDVDYTRTELRENEETGSGNSKTNTSSTDNRTTHETNVDNSTQWETYQDTPQGALDGIRSEQYLTNARRVENGGGTQNTINNNGVGTGETKAETETERSGKDNAVITMKGKTGARSKSKLLEEYRKTILNIDMMIIRDLEELFMQIW